MSIFILGPAYSGKSEIAQGLLDAEQNCVFLATAVVQEPLLAARVQRLQAQRPKIWETIDAKSDLADQLKDLLRDHPQVLLDSFNLWLANAILQAMGKYDALQLTLHFEMEVRRICECIGARKGLVIVSSEAGAGVSPPQEAARLFRQILGHAHVRIAKACDRVAFVQAGILRWEKGKAYSN